MTATITTRVSLPELATPVDVPDDYASLAAFTRLLAGLDLNRAEDINVVDVGLKIVARDLDSSDRGGRWMAFTEEVRSSSPDGIEGALRDLLGTPVAISYRGRDANDTEVDGHLEVADPPNWIRRRHRQGWQDLTVESGGVEIGGIVRCSGTGNCGVWLRGGQTADDTASAVNVDTPDSGETA